MDCRCIPHTQIPHTSKLFQDFLYNYHLVSRFYPYAPFAAESFADAARAIRYPDDRRAEVAAVLHEQNEHFRCGEATRNNLDRFAKPGCFAVVTGQQVGLFSGPAFAIYKALTAIKLARHLTERGLNAVPLFWLATEDHDFQEVSHCFIQDRDNKPSKLAYEKTPEPPDAPVGTLRFGEDVSLLIDALRGLLPDGAASEKILALIAESYRPGVRFGDAFASLMGRLFGDYGVILIDPLDARLHRLGAPAFRTAIEQGEQLTRELQRRSRELVEAGYHAQVRVTENSSMLFLIVDGQRTPLRLEEGKFTSAMLSYTPAELAKLFDSHPEMFSANVLLRPVLQDTLLPTVAYVGGPSELAYLAQAAPVYERVLGRMPVIFPRASFTLADAPVARLLAKYGLSPMDACAPRQPLREKMAARFLPPLLAAQFEKASAELERNLSELQRSLQQLDPTLVEAARHSGQKMHYQLSNLERKAAAAAQQRSGQVERDVERIENTICPEKVPQERLYSGVSLLARFGLNVLPGLLDKITVTSSDHHFLTP